VKYPTFTWYAESLGGLLKSKGFCGGDGTSYSITNPPFEAYLSPLVNGRKTPAAKSSSSTSLGLLITAFMVIEKQWLMDANSICKECWRKLNVADAGVGKTAGSHDPLGPAKFCVSVTFDGGKARPMA